MFIALVAIQIILSGLMFVPHLARIDRFLIVTIVASIFWLPLVGLALRLGHSAPRYLTIFSFVTGMMLRLLFVPVEPVASDDVYRYIWDGKVQHEGFNPYRYSPLDPEVHYLHNDIFPAKINFPEMKTVYPPLAELLFAVAWSIGGDSVLGIKTLLFIAECVTLGLLLLLLKQSGRPPILLAIYSLCPLSIVHFMIDCHCDALAFPFLIGAILLFRRQRAVPAFVMVSCAIGIKLFPLALLPAFLLCLPSWKQRVLMPLIPVTILTMLYLPYVLTGGFPFESLGIFSSKFYFNGAVFHLVLPFLGNEGAHVLCAILFFAVLIPVLLRSEGLYAKLSLTIFTFFLISPTVHPWYLTWLAVLLPLYSRWSGIAFVGLVSLSGIIYRRFLSDLVWQESSLILLIEYVPVLLLLIGEKIRPQAFIMHKKCDEWEKSSIS